MFLVVYLSLAMLSMASVFVEGLNEMCSGNIHCDVNLTCVGSPCTAVCQCAPGFKPCWYLDECIPDRSDTVLPGENCTLDSECVGIGSYCKRTATNTDRNLHGVCVGGPVAVMQSRNKIQTGGSTDVRSAHAVYMICTLVVLVTVAVFL